MRRSLVVSDSLLLYLAGIDYFKGKTRDIKQLKSRGDRVTRVLDILAGIPDNQSTALFDEFLATLRRDGQEHVGNILSQQSDARLKSDEQYQLLISRKKEICKFLDMLSGVLDELVSFSLVTDRDSIQVRAQRGLDEMARETIDILSRKADCAFDLFITALHNYTGQQHAATILIPELGIVSMSDEHYQLLIVQKNEPNYCHIRLRRFQEEGRPPWFLRNLIFDPKIGRGIDPHNF